jgi:hypothetical protein
VTSSHGKSTVAPDPPAGAVRTPGAASDAPSAGLSPPVALPSKKKSKVLSQAPQARDPSVAEASDRPKTRGRIGYLGVSRTFDGRYKAQILALGSMLQLGEFDFEEEAARCGWIPLQT